MIQMVILIYDIIRIEQMRYNHSFIYRIIQKYIISQLSTYNLQYMKNLLYKKLFEQLTLNEKYQKYTSNQINQLVDLNFIYNTIQDYHYFTLKSDRYDRLILLLELLVYRGCLEIVDDKYNQVCMIEPQCLMANFAVPPKQEWQKQVKHIIIKNVQLSISSDLVDRFNKNKGYFLKKYYYNDSCYKLIVSKDQKEFKKRQLRSKELYRMLQGNEIQNKLYQPSLKEPIIEQNEIDQKQQQALTMVIKKRLLMIKGGPGVGKTRISCKLANKLMSKRVVMMAAVSHTALRSICKQLFKQLDEKNEHNTKLVKQLSHYLKIFPQIEKMRDREMIQRQIKSGLKQSYHKNIVYFIPLLPYEQYYALNPIDRYYQLNTHIIRNILDVVPEYSLELLMKQLDKVAKCGSLKLPPKEQDTFYQLYLDAYRRTIKQARCIIMQTSHIPSLNNYQQPDQVFQPHTVFLDEASTANISDFLACLYLDIKQLVLAGDTQQLNIFEGQFPKQATLLKQKVFSILMNRYPQSVVHFDTNYRNNKQIIYFLENTIYDGTIIKNGQLQKQYEEKKQFLFQQAPIQMVGYDGHQEQQENLSYYNMYEVAMIRMFLLNFNPIEFANIGVITFYKEQQRRLRDTLKQEIKCGLQVSTVDGFQGGEKKFIFLSLVRSNQNALPIYDLTHINDKNRFTVAISRAITSLTIIGNIQTVTSQDVISAKNPLAKLPWLNVAYHLICEKKMYHLAPHQQKILQMLSKIIASKKEEKTQKIYTMNTYVQNEQEQEDNSLKSNTQKSRYPFLQYRYNTN